MQRYNIQTNIRRAALLLASLSVILLSGSCRRQSIDITLFSASLEMVTPNVYDGDDLVFNVKATKFPFIVTRFSCGFDYGDAIELNTRYQETSSGIHQFTIPSVSVPASQRRKIEMTVEDPSTGKSLDLSAYYTAHQSTDVSAYVDLPEAAGTSVAGIGAPAVIEGEGVPLVFRSKAEALTLVDHVCEFDTEGVFEDGMEIRFDSKGEWRCVLPAAAITQDVTSYKSAMSFTFEPADGQGDGKQVEAVAEYIKLVSPKAEITSITSEIIQGETFSCEISSNRKDVKLSKVSSTCKELNSASGALASDVFDNIDADVLQFPENGRLSFERSGIAVEKDESHTVTFTFIDTGYTGREFEVTGRFATKGKKAASSIKLSFEDNLTRITDEGMLVLDADTYRKGIPGYPDEPNKAIVTVGSDDKYSDGKYGYEVVPGSGEGKVTCVELSSDGAEKKYEITATGEGKLTLRFFPEGNKNAAVTLPVSVRKRLALVLDGEFKVRAFKQWGEHRDTDFGWVGHPTSTRVALLRYKPKNGRPGDVINYTEIGNEEFLENVMFSDAGNTSDANLTFSLNIQFGARVTSKFFWKCYENYDPYRDGLDGRLYVLNNEVYNKRNTDRPAALALPQQNPTKLTCECKNGSSELASLTSFLQDMNLVAAKLTGVKGSQRPVFWWAYPTTSGVESDCLTDCKGQLDMIKGISFSVSDLNYNETLYDIRYNCFMFVSRCHYEKDNRPWWLYALDYKLDYDNATVTYSYLNVSHWCEEN